MSGLHEKEFQKTVGKSREETNNVFSRLSLHINIETLLFKVVDTGEGLKTEEQKNHPSETALDNVSPDFYIYNEGSIDELQIKIDEWIKEFLTELFGG